MGACIVLTPIVIANWPMIAAAITAAAAASGFNLASGTGGAKQEAIRKNTSVDLKLDNIEDVRGSMGRDEKITVEGNGVKVIFSRDGRGHFKTCVEGNLSKEELENIGNEMAGRVIQQYVYKRVSQELEAQGFVTLDEEQTAEQSIRLRVRRYED